MGVWGVNTKGLQSVVRVARKDAGIGGEMVREGLKMWKNWWKVTRLKI